MIPIITAVGRSLIPLAARLVPSASWLALGWLSSDVADVADGKTGEDEYTGVWAIFAGIGFLLGIGITYGILKMLKRK